MTGRPFFDTNILVYAAIAPGDPRAELARQLLSEGGLISVQCLNEFVNAARHKFRRPWSEVLDAVADIRELCPEVLPSTVETHDRALAVCQRYGYGFWDGLIIAAALEGSCVTLFSEDLPDGHKIQGLTIRNPFN